MLYEYGKSTYDFFRGIQFLFWSSFLYLWGFFNLTITIPLALVAYKMLIPLCAPHWLSIISYPMLAHGIIVKYTMRNMVTNSINVTFVRFA